MQLRIHRTDGKTGNYTQNDERRSKALLARLNPKSLFASGPIVIGISNPFTVVHPDEVCWVEAETDLPTLKSMPLGVEQIELIPRRNDYEAMLARQWALWRKNAGKGGNLLEAFVEITMRGGDVLYARATGFVSEVPLVNVIFSSGALVVTRAPDITIYINPKCIVRTRVYHSRETVEYPDGLWVAEADDI